MGKIVAIGGGEIKNHETLTFDKRVVELTNKTNPKALFIPTASKEATGYIETFKNIYGHHLGCNPDVLYLLSKKPDFEEIKEKILGSDLIYVGGGNTLKMMKKWRKLGVDKLLEQAHQNGTVLSGLSAGSICWFEAGHSDSMSFKSEDNRKYIKVRGLGLLKGIHCPHFSNQERIKDFEEFIKKYKDIGIAISDNCAIEFIDNKFKVLSDSEENKAYKVFYNKKQKQVIKKEIPKFREFIDISFLYDNN
ncbi:Type 1 glutamine amidotransferase-like domain-containing protein [Candidatus Absconditicoccus praedator]|uniref:Type 1 glutamine amidotransferase-like domain-containing protein n=1 Tax=Candidatus Absconditicoccus praedator TaxID=2735562 RepID=UPI001E31D708|nr:Type 1 glutamine amidotransferase-like domain-containing protein [Candidatus Absconditicoccus praedator]UFX83440.1 Type 1 glutamine amidotransferase-like domain-containing protein [Candidatus Absconditicoccus praedator]